MRVALPLPERGFDPTESAVPWSILAKAGHTVVFLTPDGAPAAADPRMLTGEGLGPWSPLLRARRDAREAYAAMEQDPAFIAPLAYEAMDPASFDALILPGGHAPGMKPYLESAELQALVVALFAAGKPVGAICHGVVLAARSVDPTTGRSVLHGRRTTALPRTMELSAWAMTLLWLGDYYRTYPETVQDEVTRALAAPGDFQPGPPSLLRDAPTQLARGFTVRDGAYLSARWPGDAYRFATEFAAMLGAPASGSAAGPPRR